MSIRAGIMTPKSLNMNFFLQNMGIQNCVKE